MADITTLLSKFLTNLWAGNITSPVTSTAIRTSTTAADTLKIQAYDVDGTAYTDLLTVTAGNTPMLTIPVGSTTYMGVYSSALQLKSTYWISWASGNVGTASDTSLGRDAAGSVGVIGANSQRSSIAQATSLVDISTASGVGTATITIANLIPAGAIVLGATARVNTILAGAGLTTWSLGYTGQTTAFGTGLAIAATTQVDSRNTVMTAPLYSTAAANVLLTAAAGVLSTGVVRVTVHYISLSAPAS